MDVQLAALESAEGLKATIVSTLGLSGAAGSTALVLCEALRTWRALLIIDNCEHMVVAVARLVDELLAVSPGVVVLTTTREPLRLPGERLLTIGPLPEAVAVLLFFDRAAAVQRSFSADVAEDDVVGRICPRLNCCDSPSSSPRLEPSR